MYILCKHKYMLFFWSVLFETNPNKLMGFFTFRIESWYSNSHFFHLFLLRSLFILLFCNKKLTFINFLISFGNPVYRFQLTFSCSFRSVYTVSVLFGSFSIIFSILTGVTLLYRHFWFFVTCTNFITEIPQLKYPQTA